MKFNLGSATLALLLSIHASELAKAEPASAEVGEPLADENVVTDEPTMNPPLFNAKEAEWRSQLLSALEGIKAAISAGNPSQEPAGSPKITEVDRRDLAAQEAMAYWAMAMTVVSGISALVGLATLFTVVRTLRYNRLAAEATLKAAQAASEQVVEARKAGEDRVRARLKCVSGKLHVTQGFIRVSLVVENEGKSRAVSCELRCLDVIPLIDPSKRERAGNSVKFSLDMDEAKELDVWLQLGSVSATISQPLFKQVQDGGANFRMHITWGDVFGATHALRFFACAESIQRSSEGELSAKFSFRPDDPIQDSRYISPEDRYGRSVGSPSLNG